MEMVLYPFLTNERVTSPPSQFLPFIDECSHGFDEFMSFLGAKVLLSEHSGYAGGLSTSKGRVYSTSIDLVTNGFYADEATGKHSIYTEFNGIQIMMHVAPYITRVS